MKIEDKLSEFIKEKTNDLGTLAITDSPSEEYLLEICEGYFKIKTEDKVINNPSAFPFKEMSLNHQDEIYENHKGMSLRDYFANTAMQSILTGFYSTDSKMPIDEVGERLGAITKNAYWFADEMLKQRGNV